MGVLIAGILVGGLKLADWMATSEYQRKIEYIVGTSSAAAKYYQDLSVEQLKNIGASQEIIDAAKNRQATAFAWSAAAIGGALLLGTVVYFKK